MLFVGSISAIAQTTKKVCFIGNSYTYVQDLPSLLDSISNHDGNDVIKDQNTPGGSTLEQHSTNAASLSKIQADSWDYVVLQDQSQMPSFPYAQTSVSVYPKAEILCDSIRSANPCAIPLFYNTWGRESGDPQWDSINSFIKMNNRLHLGYAFMAESNQGKLSPVGIGFRHIYDDASAVVPHTDLYADAGGHPTLKGQYLSACIFYNVIFESSPVGNSFLPVGLSQSEADYLQGVAYHVVNNVDSVETDYTQPIIGCDAAVNIDHQEKEIKFNVFPNPSTGNITIQLTENNDVINIFNLEGQRVQTVIPDNSEIKMNLNPGIYFISVGGITKKVIISQ